MQPNAAVTSLKKRRDLRSNKKTNGDIRREGHVPGGTAGGRLPSSEDAAGVLGGTGTAGPWSGDGGGGGGRSGLGSGRRVLARTGTARGVAAGPRGGGGGSGSDLGSGGVEEQASAAGGGRGGLGSRQVVIV